MELDLLLDIGNTRSKWITTKSGLGGSLSIEQSGIINNQELSEQIAQQFASLLTSSPVAVIQNIFCTCVGQLDVLKIWQAHFPSATLYQLSGETVIPGFDNGYQRPTELGTDRLAGMLGAKTLYPEKNILVIASGTATTIDYLHQGSKFIGGWIIPGLDLMLKSLGKSTANLPTLEANQLTTSRDDDQTFNNQGTLAIPFGTSTKDAIGMGVVLATVGAIRQAIAQLPHLELILITGGNANLLEAYLLSDSSQVKFVQEPNLILVGLNAWRLHHKEAHI